MTREEGNREFLTKYCKIMVSKLQNSEDMNRMMAWLEAVNDDKCDEATSLMYLELMLWALHTERIDVFPFKYLPPVDHGEITDAYDYALDIVKLEPEKNHENGGEVNTVVTDNLKEFLAVQEVDGFGSQCYYAFSDKSPVSSWVMPPEINLPGQNDLCKDPKYWMSLFSRPKFSKKETQKPTDDQQNELCEEEEAPEDKLSEISEKTICPDLSKVEYILNNLSFGGKKPQDVRTLADEDESTCKGNDKRRSSALPNAAEESKISEPEEQVDTIVLNVNYSSNHFGNLSSNSKKCNRPNKNVNSKSREGQNSRRGNTCLTDFEDFEESPKRRKDKKPIWNPIDLSKASRPEDSILALYSDSFSDESRRRKQYERNLRKPPSKFTDNYIFRPSSLPGTSQPCKNGETKRGSPYRPKNTSNTNRFRKDGGNDKEKRSNFKELFKETSNYYISSRDDLESLTSDCKNDHNLNNNHERNPILSSRGKYGEGHSEDSSRLRSTRLEGYERNRIQDQYEELMTRTRSDRRLQFSEVHAEPQRHKPRLSADAPLKPCLRKLSDETQTTEVSDYRDRTRTHREFKRDPQFCYFSQPPSKPPNQRSKKQCSNPRRRTQKAPEEVHESED